MLRSTVFRCALLLAMAGAVSCATTDHPGSAASPQPAEEVLRAEYEAKLQKIARRYVESGHRNQERDRGSIAKRKPYYMKRYSVYDEIPEVLDLEVREKDSRTRPYSGELRIAKQRFYTKMHRRRKEAREDEHFYRDTGEEVVSFEMRNGRWRCVGSLFVAQTSEENVNGEWLPREVEVRGTYAGEPSNHWVKRVFRKVFRRNKD